MRGPPRARGTVSRCESSGLLTTENTDWIDTGSFGGGAERPRPSINRGARAAKGGVAEAQQGGHMLWPGLASRLCGPRRWRGASPAPHLLDFKQQGQPAGSHQLPTHCPPSPAFSASARAAPLPRAHHLQQTTPWRPHPNTQEGEMKPSSRDHQASSARDAAVGQGLGGHQRPAVPELPCGTQPLPRSACQSYCGHSNNIPTYESARRGPEPPHVLSYWKSLEVSC